MTVEIRTYRGLRRDVGEKRIEWDVEPGATVGEVLSRFAETYDVDESDVLVMKNGTHVEFIEGESTPVEEGDTLSFS